MKREISKYVAECDTSQRVKARSESGRNPSTCTYSILEMEGCQYDFIVNLPNTSQNHDSIRVIVDWLTKTTHFIPVHTNNKAKKNAEIYLDCIICMHGVPKMIISNRGAQFIARFWEQLKNPSQPN